MNRVVLVACFLLASLSVTSCDRTCESDDDCSDGFTCPFASDLGECPRRCAAQPLRGEQCSAFSDDGNDCANNFELVCADALVCATRGNEGLCVPTEGRVINETCNIDDECAANLVCAISAEGLAGECAPATGRGTDVPCDDDAQCASGSCSGGACS